MNVVGLVAVVIFCHVIENIVALIAWHHELLLMDNCSI